MLRKKIIGLLLAGAVIVSGYGVVNANSTEKTNNVKVLSYKAAPLKAVQNKNELKFDNFQCTYGGINWLNANEILSIKVKAEKKFFKDDKNTECTIDEYYYFSTLNIETGETRDFKDVNAGRISTISPNGKYVLYQEPRTIPEVESDEWKEQIKSGKLNHVSMKILNLETGAITPFNATNAPYRNSDDYYGFIDGDKIVDWSSYSKRWQIVDISGKEYKSGSLGEAGDDWVKADEKYGNISDFNLKVTGDNITGCLYLTTQIPNSCNVIIKKLDVTTNALTNVFDNGRYLEIKNDKGFRVGRTQRSKGDNYNDSILLFNNDYSLKKEIKIDQNILSFNHYNIFMDANGTLSKDASKMYFVGRDENLKAVDLTTGAVTVIYENKHNDYLCVNKDGTAFTCYDRGKETLSIINIK